MRKPTHIVDPRAPEPEVFGAGGLSYRAIAEIFGVTRMRIFQIEARAFEKMRKAVEQYAAAEGLTVREWLLGDLEEDRPLVPSGRRK